MTKTQKDQLYRYAFLIIIVLATYANTLNNGFVWDDNDVIVENSQLEKLSNIPKFFLSEDRIEVSTRYYRPLTYVSFALDRAIWGLNPVGFNITNLLLHMLVVLIFYRVVAALFKQENLALVSALIFSLHPIVVETVNFHAGGRNTLLCACFALLALFFYIKKKYLPSIICFTIAIFSKEFALLLPAVFFLYDRIISKEKTRWLAYIPYVIATVCYLALRSSAVQKASLLKTINSSDKLWTIPETIVTYLINMVIPTNLKTMYDISIPVGWSSFAWYSTALMALIICAIIFRKRTEISFSICLFLLFLLPVTNIFNLGTAMLADRYAYFALFGFSLALAYFICLVKKPLAVTVLIIVCVFFITIDVQRNKVWSNEITLFTQMTKDAPEMCIGYQNLGYAYYDGQDFTNAEKNLTIAFSKKGLGGSMLVGSASMFLEMNKPQKALSALHLKIKYEPNNPQSYIMASTIYENMGDKTMAKIYHDKAVALNPEIFVMMKKRVLQVTRQSEDLMAKHNLNNAERLLKEALSIDPLYVPALIDMGSLVAEKGDLAKSIHYFNKAVVLEPLNPVPHFNLSKVYESLGKTVESLNEMEQYRRLDASLQKKESSVQRLSH